MGLLARALLGGISQAGETVANMMVQNNQAELQAKYQTERDQAQALREENLTRLRAQLGDQSAEKQRAFETKKMDTEYDRGPSGMVDTETGAPLTRAEAKAADTDSKITPEDAKLDPSYLVDGKPASSWDVKVALQDKPDSVTRVKEVDADARAEAIKEVAQMKIDAANQVAEMKLQNARDLVRMRLDAGHSADSKEVKQLMAQIRQTEEQRKAADSAAKMLDATGGDMNPEQKRLYDNYLKMAGVDAAPAAATEKPKKKGGLLSALGFGSSDASAAPAPTAAAPAAAPAPQLSSGAAGVYDFNSLPKGAQPVPGKFTTDGRPVFKVGSKYVAPKLKK